MMMKRDNSKNRNKISKAKLIFGVGVAAFTLISHSYTIYKEQQGDLSAAFPEAESEINEAIEAVRREKEAEADE
ncbi:MAG: hypothetical protein K2G60_02675 [Oscillospiraceae bacterium]|nr:hypothetical protein [Oscillospiraceae bacterium]